MVESRSRESGAGTSARHWTARSSEDLVFRIGHDVVRQIEDAMEAAGVSRSELALRLGVSRGRVSQVLGNPGNLTLERIVEYCGVLGLKASVVAYNDRDPGNAYYR